MELTEITRERLVEALRALVRIPSVNPNLVPGAAGERALAEAIAARLGRSPGIAVALEDAGGGRPNVVAAVGAGRGRTLLLNGHLDTVGVAGMAAPFAGRVVGRRLYGRGAVDMKASLAAMVV